MKSIRQVGVGQCDMPFERFMVLARAIFHSVCVGDIELALSFAAASLVGKPQAWFEARVLRLLCWWIQFL